jgi:hypothetical protein
MTAAYLVVRAVVADPADRAAFDHWYRTEHLPDALKAFNARSAMRGWSTQDPSVHTAFYRFDSVEAANAIGGSSAIKALIAEFDRCWGPRVIRGRDIMTIADELQGMKPNE